MIKKSNNQNSSNKLKIFIYLFIVVIVMVGAYMLYTSVEPSSLTGKPYGVLCDTQLDCGEGEICYDGECLVGISNLESKKFYLDGGLCLELNLDTINNQGQPDENYDVGFKTCESEIEPTCTQNEECNEGQVCYKENGEVNGECLTLKDLPLNEAYCFDGKSTITYQGLDDNNDPQFILGDCQFSLDLQEDGNGCYVMATGVPGNIYNFDGTEWNDLTGVDNGITPVLTNIWGDSSDDLYFMAGYNIKNEFIGVQEELLPTLYNYDGNVLKPLDLDANVLELYSDIQGFSNEEKYILANENMFGDEIPIPLLYKSIAEGSWVYNQLPQNTLGTIMTHINIVAPNDYYLLGVNFNDESSKILHYKNNDWVPVIAPNIDFNEMIFLDIWSSSPEDVYILGWEEDGVVLLHSGEQGFEDITNDLNLDDSLQYIFGMWGTAEDDIYLAGSEEIYADLNHELLACTLDSECDSKCIDKICKEPVMKSVVYHYDGETWSDILIAENLLNTFLLDVWGDGNGNVYASGLREVKENGITSENGIILYNDPDNTETPEGTWTNYNVENIDSFTTVFGVCEDCEKTGCEDSETCNVDTGACICATDDACLTGQTCVEGQCLEPSNCADDEGCNGGVCSITSEIIDGVAVAWLSQGEFLSTTIDGVNHIIEMVDVTLASTGEITTCNFLVDDQSVFVDKGTTEIVNNVVLGVTDSNTISSPTQNVNICKISIATSSGSEVMLDVTDGTCVECLVDADCSASNPVCDANVCTAAPVVVDPNANQQQQVGGTSSSSSSSGNQCTIAKDPVACSKKKDITPCVESKIIYTCESTCGTSLLFQYDCDGNTVSFAPGCNNKVRDVLEEGIDCGGPCATKCPDYCKNNKKDADEKGIDCGGKRCKPCAPVLVKGTAKVETKTEVKPEQPPVVQEPKSNLRWFLLGLIPLFLVIGLIVFLIVRKHPPQNMASVGTTSIRKEGVKSIPEMEEKPKSLPPLEKPKVIEEPKVVDKTKMDKAKLKSFVKSELHNGKSKEQITKSLERLGYHVEHIEYFFDKKMHEVMPKHYEKQMRDFILAQLDKGKSPLEIRNLLKEQGWSDGVVDKFLIE